MPRMSVWVKFTVPGVHRWADSTGYLQYPHRHLFHVRVEVTVRHGDREVEFLKLLWDSRTLFEGQAPAKRQQPGGVPDFGLCSCEHLAGRLWEALQSRGYNLVAVEVSEDGENGASLKGDYDA